jgi:hypothetical protein
MAAARRTRAQARIQERGVRIDKFFQGLIEEGFVVLRRFLPVAVVTRALDIATTAQVRSNLLMPPSRLSTLELT